MITVYGMSMSGNCYKLRLLLEQQGREYRWVEVDSARGGTRTPGFLAKNPNGKVPVIELDDGRVLAESNAILCWLAEGATVPGRSFLPSDPWQKAQALSWMSFLAATVHPARRFGLAVASDVYRLADQRLGAAEWALGRYSIVDIHLFRLYWRFTNAMKTETPMFPNLAAHHDRMMRRPAVQRTLQVESAIGYELPA